VAGSREFRTLHHGQVGNRTDRPGSWGPRCVDFSGDGRVLASASLDGVRLWDVGAPATEIAYLPVGSSGTALFQPGGSRLLTYGAKGLRLWPLQSGPPTPEGHVALGPARVLSSLPGSQSSCACWAADGRSLLAADWNQSRALLLHLDDPGKPLELKPHRNSGVVALSPAGEWAATFGWQSNDLIVWNAKNGREAWRRPLTRGNVAFNPAGGLLVTIGAEQGIHFRDVASGEPKLRVPTAGASPFAIAFNADGTILAVGESGRGIRLLGPATGRELATLDAPYDQGCRWLSFSPDGSQLAASTGNHTIQLWDLRLMRQHLADLDLDWHLPTYPLAKAPGAPVRLEIRLDPDLLYARALHWQRTGDYAQAVADLRACLKGDAGRADACNLLAWFLVAGPAELRNPDEALPLAEQAVARRPDDGNYRNTLGVVYYRLGRYEQAVDTLARNRRQSRGRLAACDGFFLAMSHQRLGQTEQARDSYFQAVREQAEAKLTGRFADQLNAFRAEAEALLGTPPGRLPR
jgi:tetratricopeptide repeat protein/WD40 domain-containing protein